MTAMKFVGALRMFRIVFWAGCLLIGSLLTPAAIYAQPAGTPPAPAAETEKKGDEPDNPFPNRSPASELDGGIAWLNSKPLSLGDLRGKVVLIDFWTFCCINCMHVLPDLKYLEHKYPNELAVIGCHSAKFENEKETESIRQAILRYEIEHPVINDAEMTVWRKFGVRAWPSLVVIDPEGFYCGYVSGEGNRELLETVIDRLIKYHSAKGTLKREPLKFELERDKQVATPLKYPGKLLADGANNRLFISDSNHNRIVVSDLSGKLIDVIGTGAMGSHDGSYGQAQFDHPQGLALSGDLLYVADTENHLIRVIDLKQKIVSTLAGTGEQARSRAPGGPLTETALNSPWDLCIAHNVLYIAMAGPHQIWSHQIGSKTIQQYAGSGREDIRNGSLSESALAQPSGIVTDNNFLYVVDSEGSAVRKISIKKENSLSSPTGTVTTLAGTFDLPNGRTLFEFGDKDGIGKAARLQHPLGLVQFGDSLLIADTYNHKIKQLTLKDSNCQSFLGTTVGRGLNPLQLSEPAGMTIVGQRLLIADTNNHRVVEVDLKTKLAKDFPIQGLTPPAK